MSKIFNLRVNVKRRGYLFWFHFFILAFIFTILALNHDSICYGASSNVQKNLNSTNLRGRPFHGTVKLVDVSQSYVLLEGKAAQKFFITPRTVIKIDGSEGKLHQIEAGKYIGGYAKESSEGRWVATTLNVYSERSKTNKPSF